jgi:hypothetical protein
VALVVAGVTFFGPAVRERSLYETERPLVVCGRRAVRFVYRSGRNSGAEPRTT